MWHHFAWWAWYVFSCCSHVLRWANSLGSAGPSSEPMGWGAGFPGQTLVDWTVQSDWQFLSDLNSAGRGTFENEGKSQECRERQESNVIECWRWQRVEAKLTWEGEQRSYRESPADQGSEGRKLKEKQNQDIEEQLLIESFCSINCRYYIVLSEYCNIFVWCVHVTINKGITKKHYDFYIH